MTGTSLPRRDTGAREVDKAAIESAVRGATRNTGQ
jgi:hypothetical protein